MEYSKWPKGDLDKLTNKALVNKATKGCSESFGEIIHRDSEYIRGWLLKKTADELLAEELLQITLIRCWKNIRKFKGQSTFRTWACTIAKNLVIDNYRKIQRRREVSLESSPEGINKLKFSKTDFDPLRKFKNEELKMFLSQVMDKLPATHRNVLQHFAVGQLSYLEISRLEKCSIGTVMSRLFYARKKAQDLVKKHKSYKVLWD
jgi:RNA polymerase sigma-70 factor (ECF subfamily)